MLVKVLSFVAVLGGITLAIAVGLIFSQRPIDLPPGEGLDFTQTLNQKRADPMAQSGVVMRDGYEAQVRRYDTSSEQAPLLILLHGSGWHGLQFDPLAQDLSQVAQVVVPDLRGHGPKPGTRGDIAYINQFEDDLADLIKAEAASGQKVVLAGHSSGGGLVTRFAGGEHGHMVDAAVLVAPFLKHNAPMTRQNSGGWAYPLVRRLIGLSMLNSVGITGLNHLTIMQFRMPQVVLDGPLGHTATTSYSYRLNRGFAPRSDYLADVRALPPFTLIVGTQDEAFDAALYEPTLKEVTDKGQYTLIPDVGHLDIVTAPQTRAAIESLINDL
ncbi:MAG: alpha/beta fold hydrolase [Sulfitobacter sp.]